MAPMPHIIIEVSKIVNFIQKKKKKKIKLKSPVSIYMNLKSWGH